MTSCEKAGVKSNPSSELLHAALVLGPDPACFLPLLPCPWSKSSACCWDALGKPSLQNYLSFGRETACIIHQWQKRQVFFLPFFLKPTPEQITQKCVFGGRVNRLVCTCKGDSLCVDGFLVIVEKSTFRVKKIQNTASLGLYFE